jgi:two-component sensor histidine kinase
VSRFLFIISLFIVTLCSSQHAGAQRAFLSDYANEQLKNVPVEQQDSFFLLQGKYYYAFYTRESYRRAMECYLEALRLALNYKHQSIVVKCYFGIGSVYDANNNLPQAIRYYKMNYDGVLKERPFKPINILRATYNIAATYAKARDTANAYDYSLKMGQMLTWIQDPQSREGYRLLIAHTFAGIGKTDEFIDYFSQIPADITFKDGELAYGRLYAETKSRYALLLGKRDEVVPPLLKELEHTRDSIPLLNLLLKSYAALGDYKKAYECQQMLIAADMRSMDRSTYGDINYRLLEADNLLKQKQNNELKVNEEELRFNSSILYTVSLLLALGLVITLYLYRRYRIRNKFSDQRKAMVNLQNETNNLLIADVHHNISDTMFMLNNLMEAQLSKSDADLYTAMREVQAKMLAVASAHRMVYAQGDAKEIDLQSYFEELLETVLHVLPAAVRPKAVSVAMHGNRLGVKKLVELSFVITEMIIASIKYASPVNAGLSISMDSKVIDGEMHFTYADSGTDIVSATDENTDTITGISLRLIHKFARQMGAKILAERDNDSGTRYLLIFTKN